MASNSSNLPSLKVGDRIKFQQQVGTVVSIPNDLTVEVQWKTRQKSILYQYQVKKIKQ